MRTLRCWVALNKLILVSLYDVILSILVNSIWQISLIKQKRYLYCGPHWHLDSLEATFNVAMLSHSLGEKPKYYLIAVWPIIISHFWCIFVWFNNSHRKWRSKLKQMKRKSRRQMDAQQRDELAKATRCSDGLLIVLPAWQYASAIFDVIMYPSVTSWSCTKIAKHRVMIV